MSNKLECGFLQGNVELQAFRGNLASKHDTTGVSVGSHEVLREEQGRADSLALWFAKEEEP